LNFSFYYILVACTAAYTVMVVLGWRIWSYVKRHLRGASNTQRRALEAQRQLTLTLIIQVSDVFWL
jgi:hypothetical protein